MNQKPVVFTVLTLFPDTLEALRSYGAIGKALTQGRVILNVTSIRQFAQDGHRTVDDSPYGGGAGMILRADILKRAWSAAVEAYPDYPHKTLFLSPQGATWTQARAREALGELTTGLHFIFIAGHYEAIDERFISRYVDQEISIGDYILTGGELPAIVVLESIIRLLPGVVGNRDNTEADSFDYQGGLLKYPQYTRPPEFEGEKVPEVLLSGNHAKIEAYRAEEALRVTAAKRPDLLAKKNHKS